MPAPDILPSAVIKNSFLDGIFATVFGTRNMLNGIAGMVSIVGFGYLLDGVTRHFPDGQMRGFSIVFVSAVVCGMITWDFCGG